MSDKIRVGVISTSWWADMMFLPALKSHPQAEIAAICGRNRSRAEEMAGKYGIAQVFTDYREMIEKGKLHALIVAAPDDLHYSMTMEALDAGLHILCEKPLALKADQAREMAEKAAVAGVKHMVYFTWRWLPQYQYLRRLIDEEYIGRCYHCQMHYLDGYGRASQYGWRFDGNRANGVLGDLGSHMIDLARLFVGDIARVSAQLSCFIKRPGSDDQPLDPANDSAVLMLQFKNGAQGIIQVSAVAHMAERWQQQRVILYGEAGTLEADFNLLTEAEVRGARHDEECFSVLPIPDNLRGKIERSTPFNELKELFIKQPVGVRLFIDAILEDRPVSPNFDDGFKVQEVIDAAIESDRTGCWVTLP